jgi:hypothetical protein
MQATVMKSYPPKLLFVTLQCFLSTIQSFAIAIAFERDPHQWKLGWNVRLVAVAYCVTLFDLFLCSIISIFIHLSNIYIYIYIYIYFLFSDKLNYELSFIFKDE